MSIIQEFSSDEVQQYLVRIKYPHNVGDIVPNLDTLVSLTSHHKLAIPFGALDLVYYKNSSAKNKYKISIEPRVIFDKLVLEKREGNCLEQSILLANILKNTGFQVFLTTSRVVDMKKRKKGKIEYQGRFHCVSIVTISDQRYIIDVGFRIPGLPIVNSIDEPDPKNPNHRIRETSTVPGLKTFVYESNDTGTFLPYYTFDMVPCTYHDLEIINFYVNNHHDSIFSQNLIVSQSRECGHANLNNTKLTIKDRDGTITRRLMTEADRRQAYLEVFGVIAPEGPEHLPRNMNMMPKL